VTIALAVALAFTIAVFALRFARAGVAVPLTGGWRWHPSLLGIAVVLLLSGLLLWRFVPELLFIPIVLPIFWWGRWGRSNGRREGDEKRAQGRLPGPRER
jgi:hypothetical protein